MKELTRARRHFAEELDNLKQRLVAMGRLVEGRIRLAIQGLIARDVGATRTVIEGDEEVDQLQVEIDDRTRRRPSEMQPAAGRHARAVVEQGPVIA